MRYHRFTALAFLIFVTLSGCSSTKDESARNAAVVADLNDWWKKDTFAPVPTKPGSVTAAHTFTFKGREHKVAKHVQTKAEYREELEDAQWQEHRRSIVLGFSVARDTVMVMTNLTRDSTFDGNPIDRRDAQELCHDLGSFVWAKEYRHWGLNNIKIVGGKGDLLSSRILGGKVQ